MIVAVLDPGLGHSSVSVFDDGREEASFSAAGGLDGVLGLFDLVSDCFVIDEWRLVAGGVASQLLASDLVMAACGRLGITLVLVVEQRDGWPPALDLPAGWPARLDLFPRVRRFWASARGWLVEWSV